MRGFAGRLATVSEDGYPYCVPLLYVWADGQVFLHGTSARGHLRRNVEREPRVCFEIDEPDEVFDYGRFECDSGPGVPQRHPVRHGFASRTIPRPSSGSANA